MTIHNCELCKVETNLDRGFINIDEICTAEDVVKQQFEEQFKVDLLNFWCAKCAEKTIKQLEETI